MKYCVITSLLLISFLTSCKKEDNNPNHVVKQYEEGVYATIDDQKYKGTDQGYLYNLYPSGAVVEITSRGFTEDSTSVFMILKISPFLENKNIYSTKDGFTANIISSLGNENEYYNTGNGDMNIEIYSDSVFRASFNFEALDSTNKKINVVGTAHIRL